MSRSTAICRLLLRRRILSTAPKYSAHPFVPYSPPPNPIFAALATRNFSSNFRNLSPNARFAAAERAFDEIFAEAERERQREREEKIKAGVDVKDLDDEKEEDYLGLAPRIAKYEKQNAKDKEHELNMREERSDSDSEPEDEEAYNMRVDMFEKKFEQFEKLLDKFAKAGS